MALNLMIAVDGTLWCCGANNQTPAMIPLPTQATHFLSQAEGFKTEEKICLSISGFHPEHWHLGVESKCVC